MPSPISIKLIEDTARELMARAAIDIPADYREGVRKARDREQNRIARFVLTEMDRNWDIATEERRPMCADTGLPRYYVRVGQRGAGRRWLRGPRARAAPSDRRRDRVDPAPAQPRPSPDPRGPRQ